jgi:hypothetical protein
VPAHQIEKLVADQIPAIGRDRGLQGRVLGAVRERGEAVDEAALRRRLGLFDPVWEARLTQVMDLLRLAPDIQEAVLDGRADGPGAELGLRAVAAESAWPAQRATWVRGGAPVATRSSAR